MTSALDVHRASAVLCGGLEHVNPAFSIFSIPIFCFQDHEIPAFLQTTPAFISVSNGAFYGALYSAS